MRRAVVGRLVSALALFQLTCRSSFGPNRRDTAESEADTAPDALTLPHTAGYLSVDVDKAMDVARGVMEDQSLGDISLYFSKCVALSQFPIEIRDGYAARRFLRWKRDRPCLLAYPKADFMTSGTRF